MSRHVLVSGLATVLIAMGLAFVATVDAQEINDDSQTSLLQPSVIICGTPPAGDTATRCSSASRCATFWPTGDITRDLMADQCYYGSRFTPALTDRFAVKFECPRSIDTQRVGGWCANLVIDSSVDQCQASWATLGLEQRKAQYTANASRVHTMNVVCNQCQYRDGMGYWRLSCGDPGATLTAPPQGATGFQPQQGQPSATLYSGCNNQCNDCGTTTHISADVSQATCLQMKAITGDKNRAATLLGLPYQCQWSGVKVFLPPQRPAESNDWIGRCFGAFDESTSMIGYEYMIDGGCIPLPGYSTMDVGPTISVSCKPYDVKPTWMGAGRKGRTEDPPESKATLGIMVILLLVAIGAIVVISFFIVRSRRRAQQLEAERTTYLHAVDVPDNRPAPAVQQRVHSPPVQFHSPVGAYQQQPQRGPATRTAHTLNDDDYDDRENTQMMGGRRR